eukprot:366318-Chlamydomonas_euryale.AAC.3
MCTWGARGARMHIGAHAHLYRTWTHMHMGRTCSTTVLRGRSTIHKGCGTGTGSPRRRDLHEDAAICARAPQAAGCHHHLVSAFGCARCLSFRRLPGQRTHRASIPQVFGQPCPTLKDSRLSDVVAVKHPDADTVKVPLWLLALCVLANDDVLELAHVWQLECKHIHTTWLEAAGRAGQQDLPRVALLAVDLQEHARVCAGAW